MQAKKDTGNKAKKGYARYYASRWQTHQPQPCPICHGDGSYIAGGVLRVCRCGGK